MTQISWNTTDMRWQKKLIRREIKQLSLAFLVIYIFSVAICLALEMSMIWITIMIAMLYCLMLSAVVGQRWERHKYAIDGDTFTISVVNGVSETIDSTNFKIKSIQTVEDFHMIFGTKGNQGLTIYVERNSPIWEMLKSMLKIER